MGTLTRCHGLGRLCLRGDTISALPVRSLKMDQRIHFGSFALSIDERQLTREGQCVHLTPKAFDLLVVLIEEAPRVVHKRELHERLWPDTFVADATLVSLVKEVRRALEDERRGVVIRTAHRVGYAFAVSIHHDALEQAGVARWLTVGAREIPLAFGENLIGRGAEAVVRLEVPGVSRRHARIVVIGRRAVLEDLGSKNGTSVRKLRLTSPIELRNADEINVGGITIVFHVRETCVETETVDSGS